MKSRLRVYIASFHFQTLTTELNALNTEHRLLSHRDLMRLVATGPLGGHAVIPFEDLKIS